jgi:subtilisin family serine protease
MMLQKNARWITTLLIVMMLFIAVSPVVAAPKDTVRVWVSYQTGKKAEVGQALGKAKAEVHFDFPELEAYVVTMPEAALNGILHNPFVIDVEEDPVRSAIDPIKVAIAPGPDDTVDVNGQVVPWGIDAVQAREVWDADYDAVVDDGAPDGSGVTVCIIDSGYYAGHEDLMDSATGLSQVDDDYLRDGYGHGTHVAGTISALNNAIGVVGVTPGSVDLTIVKIFADDGGWTNASNLVDAIYTCRDNGANVISMSLGGSSSSRKEQRAFDTLYSAGILSIAAAGNEQLETPGALEYPSSYSSVVSVAAVDSAMNVADFSNQNSEVEIAAPGVGVLSTIPYVDTNLVNVAGVDYSANHVEYSALGTASGALVDGGLCTTSGAWAGQVVLCERGDISFYDKVMNVQNGGGAAAILYNNEPGNFFGTLGDGASSSIIGVSLSQEDGQYLVANQLGTEATVASIHDWPTSGYEAWNGTSMATPHVSAVAALIWSANPSWTNAEIREALDATAIDLGAAGRDAVFGYGLVQAAAALDYLGGMTPPPPPPPPPTGALSVDILAPADGTVFANRSTVTVQVAVSDDEGAAVSGAAVTIVITGVTGKIQNLSGTTGADGLVSASYKINAGKLGYGTYTLDVVATMDGYDPGSASGTIIVQ